MGPIVTITDLANEALTPYARLTEHQLRAGSLDRDGCFIAESKTVVRLALENGYEPISFLVEQSQMEAFLGFASSFSAEAPIYTAPGALLSALTGYHLSQGVLSLMRRKPLPSPEALLGSAERVALLEDVADSVNVGALMRSAAAMGVDAVLLSPRCADPLLRRAARVSMGTVFQIPWTYLGEEEGWPTDGMTILGRLGFQTAAMALRKDSLSIDDPALKRCERLAILLGSEGHGLRDETISLCDYVVRIPMYHGVDSLNVAAAGAVAFWELCRRG